MTREEALDELNVIYERLSHPENCEQGVYSFRDGDYLEALDMAIKSLEAWGKVKSDIAERTKHLDEHNKEDLRELVGLAYTLSVVVEHLQEVSE